VITITLCGTQCTLLHQELTLILALQFPAPITWQCIDASELCQAAYSAQNPAPLLTLLKQSDLNLLAEHQPQTQQWLREVLSQSATGYSTLPSHPEPWLSAATLAVTHLLERPTTSVNAPRWQWLCDKCDDAECEQHLRLFGWDPVKAKSNLT
jgi:hypothetical protein